MSFQYCTPESVQSELKATTAFSSDTTPSLNTVNTWIEQESAQINRDAGRTYGVTQYEQFIDYDGAELIQLKHAPIVSISSLLYSTAPYGNDNYTLSATLPNGETLTKDTHYGIYENQGEVLINFNRWTPQCGRRRMKITYIAGYTTIPLEVEKLCAKMVALRIMDTVVNDDLNTKKSGKSISVGSISIVKSSDIGVAQYDTIKQEIANLKADVTKTSGVYRYTNYYY